MKIRTGGGIAEEMARALGASAFVKPAPESYELLSSGVADGTFFPLESIISFKLGSVIKYATLFPGGFYSSSFGFFMNEDKWNKLSKQDQDAIASVSGEPLALLAGKAWDATDAAALEEMKRVGIQISDGVARADQGRAGASQGDRRQVGQGRHRQGHRRRQGARGVPRRAQARRCRQVTTEPMTSHDAACDVTTLRGGRLARSRAGRRRGHFAVLPDGFDDGRRRRPLHLQLAAARRLRDHRAVAADADLRRTAARLAGRRARHARLHRHGAQ